MPTDCIPGLFGFSGVEGRCVVAAFDGGAVTSDPGALAAAAHEVDAARVPRLNLPSSRPSKATQNSPS